MIFARQKLFLLFVLLLLHAPARAQSVIKNIRVQADGDIDAALVTHLLEIKEGDVYSAAKVEEGVIRLGELGRFKYVETHFDPLAGILFLELNIVETLAGVDVLSSDKKAFEGLDSDINEVVGVSIGDPIFIDLFDEIRTRITARLFDRGYLNAKVALALEQKDRSASRRLLVSVDPGKRTRIRKFHLNGFRNTDVRELFKFIRSQSELEQFVSSLMFEDAFNLSKSAISHSIGLRNEEDIKTHVIGADVPLDWIAVTATLSKWASSARQSGFFDFSAKASVIEGTLSGDSVEVQVNLNRGVQFDVQIENNVVLWERELKASILDRTLRLGVPFSIGDAELIIRRSYESLGYRDVKVNTVSTEKENRRRIRILLTEGEQFTTGKVTIGGISDAETVDLGSVAKDWLKPLESPFHRTYYDEALFKSKQKDLLKLIRAKGFVQARILEYRTSQGVNPQVVDIEISVQLGPKYFIRNVTVSGNRVLTEQELDEIVTYEPGKPVDPSKLAEISQKLILKYQDMGFPNIKVSDEEKQVFKVRTDTNDVDVDIKIDTGPQVILGNVYIQGLKQTKNEVVLRELKQSGVDQNKIWKVSALSQAEQRLLGLGIFSSARFDSSGGRILERPKDESGVEKQERDLRLDINERNAGAFEFGPGYRTELGVVGFAEFNYRNLGGLNRGLVLRAQLSHKTEDFVEWEKMYTATFLEPYIYNDPTRVRLNVSYSLDDQYVFDQHVKKNGFLKSELSVGVVADRELFRNVRITQNIFTYSMPQIIDPIGLDYQVTKNKDYKIGTMGTILTYDTRNNLFNPSGGMVGMMNLEYSAPWIASDPNAHYFTGRWGLSSYVSIGSGVVLASNFSFARLWGLGETQGIPENKRLSLGGLSSIRSINEGGLLSLPGALVQQQSMEGKIEFRQPIFLDLGISYFFDFGQIWALQYLPDQSNNPQAPSATGWRLGVGFGLRYNTVVGPVSADVVYNPDPQPGLGNDVINFQLSIGTF